MADPLRGLCGYVHHLRPTQGSQCRYLRLSSALQLEGLDQELDDLRVGASREADGAVVGDPLAGDVRLPDGEIRGGQHGPVLGLAVPELFALRGAPEPEG